MLEASRVVTRARPFQKRRERTEMGDWQVSVAITTKTVIAREEFENVTLLLARDSFTSLRVSLFLLMKSQRQPEQPHISGTIFFYIKRMNGKWSGKSFLLGFSSLSNHGS